MSNRTLKLYIYLCISHTSRPLWTNKISEQADVDVIAADFASEESFFDFLFEMLSILIKNREMIMCGLITYHIELLLAVDVLIIHSCSSVCTSGGCISLRRSAMGAQPSVSLGYLGGCPRCSSCRRCWYSSLWSVGSPVHPCKRHTQQCHSEVRTSVDILMAVVSTLCKYHL